MFELLLALVLTMAAISLHWRNFSSAGGFWRDEANSITLSLLPDLEKLWIALQHDSFPALHYLVIRAWALLAGSGDTQLRFLGLFAGILLVVALWLKSSWMEHRAPVISLLLIGLNPLMIRHLDAIRPNGMAAIATTLAFTMVWRAIKRTDAISITLAAATILLSAQMLFQDAIFILAIGIAAIITGFYLDGLRKAALLAIPFIVAPLSLIPYTAHLRDSAGWIPVAMPLPEDKSLLPGLIKLVSAPLPWMKWIWILMGVTVLACAIKGFAKRKVSSAIDEGSFELQLYCGVTLLSGAIFFMFFLDRGAGISPQPWHYAPFLVLMVVAAEALIFTCLKSSGCRLLLLLVVMLCGAAAVYPSEKQLRARMTSMDIVAAAVSREAGPEDLVVLVPWHNGVSFSRYYHGRAPWMSFPALKENSLHRYDLLKQRMMRPEDVAGDLETVLETLQRGGKVWVVGSAFAMEPGTVIEPLPPAPLSVSGWSSVPYLSNWNKQLLASLATHSVTADQLSLAVPWTFSQESPLIRVFNGYRK